MSTQYQNDVITELKEMLRIGMINKQRYSYAVVQVGDAFSESTGMSTTEAASLAVDLAECCE